MPQPLIYHIDVNSAFLSWEAAELLRQDPDAPDIRSFPSVIGGSEKTRHGIVLAKSPAAAALGVCTGEPLAQARRKCPDLKIYAPHYSIYVERSRQFMALLKEYAPSVDAYSIDEAFCDDMIRVGNFVPAISAEGNEHTTDARRGEGTYAKIEHAMKLLRERDLPFGISTCWTSANADTVATEENMDWMIGEGALFCWYFHFMPVGRNATPELMPTPEQREHMYHFIREMREKKQLFTLDFQNDGEFVGGCIAGGKNYLHINPNGDVEPCVFIHYSNINIKEHSLLECLQQPLFMQYHDNMPFNDNQLRPCPMLENPEMIKKMVEASGAHSTDMQAEEPVDSLIAKTIPYAENWKPVADRLWKERQDEVAEARKERFEKYGE